MAAVQQWLFPQPTRASLASCFTGAFESTMAAWTVVSGVLVYSAVSTPYGFGVNAPSAAYGNQPRIRRDFSSLLLASLRVRFRLPSLTAETAAGLSLKQVSGPNIGLQPRQSFEIDNDQRPTVFIDGQVYSAAPAALSADFWYEWLLELAPSGDLTSTITTVGGGLVHTGVLGTTHTPRLVDAVEISDSVSFAVPTTPTVYAQLQVCP